MNTITTTENNQTDTDFEVRSLDALPNAEPLKSERLFSYTKYFITGILFGII